MQPDDTINIARQFKKYIDDDLNGDMKLAGELFAIVMNFQVVEHQLEDHKLSMENPQMMQRIEAYMRQITEEERKGEN